MIIRKENPNDFNEITTLLDNAFKGTYESALVNKIRKNPKHIPELSLVAEDISQITGYLLFSEINIINGDNKYSGGLTLAPLAAKEGFQKQGIGKALVNQGLSLAKALGYKFVVVLGHHEYYPKFNFEKASKYNIKCPFEVPDESFMVLELVPGILNNITGTVEYLPEFN